MDMMTLANALAPAAPSTPLVILPALIEYAALITGSISGSLMAADRRLDIVGSLGLALTTGLGGGLLRDVILPTTSVYMLDHPIAVLTCLGMGMLVFLFRGLFARVNASRVILWADILSVAFFAVSGADKALVLGYNAVACTLLGLITAVGGGVIRDVCLTEIPIIFKRGTYYAIAALAGAAVYVIMSELWVSKVIGFGVAVIVTCALRMLSVHFNLQSSTARDLTPRVTRPLRRAWKAMRDRTSGKGDNRP